MSRPETMPRSTRSNLHTVWRHMTPARRFDVLKVFMLVVASGFAELLSIGAVIPFMALLAGLQTDSLPAWLAEWIAPLGLDTTQLMIAATAVLAIAALIAGAVRLLLAWKSQKVVFEAAYAAVVGQLRAQLPHLQHYVCVGNTPDWAESYETLLASAKAGPIAPTRVDVPDSSTG